MPRGGARQGGGRKALSPEEKAANKTYRLDPKTIAEIAYLASEFDKSQSEIIRMCISRRYTEHVQDARDTIEGLNILDISEDTEALACEAMWKDSLSRIPHEPE